MINFASAITWDNVAYYKLDETSGAVIDATANGLNGTSYNTTRGVSGILNTAYYFNKSDSNYVNITANVKLRPSNLTFNVWFKTICNYDVGGAGEYLVNFHSSSTAYGYFGGIRLGANSTGGNYCSSLYVIFYNVTGSSIDVMGTSQNNNNNNWHMATVTFNGTNLSLYKDGVLENSKVVPLTSINWSNQDLSIGRLVGQAEKYYFNGTMDEVGIWNRSLSASEVTELYNSGAGLVYSGIGEASVTLISPANETVLSATGTNFTANFNTTGTNPNNYTWKNATYQVWRNGIAFNSTTVNLSGNNTQNILYIDEFTIGNYKWNVLGWYGNNTFADYTTAINNFTFQVGATLSNVTYNSNVYETSSQMFSGKLKLLEGTSLYDIQIVYNGTEYSGNLTDLGNSNYLAYSIIDIPTVTTQTNYLFYFKLIYSIGAGSFLYQNTTSYNQTVNPISLINCTSATNQTLNFTAKNEEDLTSLINWNFVGTFEYWIGSGTIRKNISINNLNINYSALCINPNNLTYKADAVIQYEKDDFVKRNYYFYNTSLTNTTQNVVLYLLNKTQSTAFIISVKDGSQLPITNAYIYVQRYYPGTGLYQTVAMSKTDGNGNTVAHFEAETEDYRIIIMKNGIIIYTSPIQKVYCSATPCTLPIQTESAGVSGWAYVGNLTNLIYYGPTYDSDTGIISYTYIDTSGTTNYGRLFVYTINSAIGKQTICNVTSVSNAATLICNVTGIEGTVYAESYISRSPEILVWGVSFVLKTLKAIMGMEGLFWATIIIVIFATAGVLMGGVSGGIVGSIIGIIGTGWLGIASFGTITLWGLIILGVFIIWQIKS